MRAEIIAIGDELTSGQRLDTNSQWLSQRLGELGVPVAFHTTVGDDLEANVAVFRTAIDRAEFVVATGGLGPTADDLTREALALAAGVELVQDDAALAHIRNLFAGRGRPMPERNALQAQFPRGGRPVPNPHGTAPGIEMIVTRPCCAPCRFFALPGVPAEMFAMWEASVAPAIAAALPTRRVIRHRRIKCFGIGESDLEAMLPDMIRRRREPLVGITVSGATITLRITASGPNDATCMQAMEPTVQQIYELLGVLVFGEEDDEMEHAVVRLLVGRGRTLSVAEWATDGLISNWLAEATVELGPFRDGVVVRDAAAAAAMFGIDVPAGSECEAGTALSMARAIREKTGTDYGLGVAAFPPLGIALHTAASGKPWEVERTGLLQVALASTDNVRTKGLPLASHPAITKPRAAKQALNMLRLAMLNRESSRGAPIRVHRPTPGVIRLHRIRLAAAALNQTPLAWDSNSRHIRAALEAARDVGVGILCLPELGITGYGCEDMFFSAGVQQTALEVLQSILPDTVGLVACVGLPVFHDGAVYNAAAVACNGRLLGFVAKQHLAGDGIHYEPRWFRRWPAGIVSTIEVGGAGFPLGDVLFDCGGIRIGLEICRDAWVADRTGMRLTQRGADVLLNPSASHFAFAKQQIRERFVLEGSRAFCVSYAYCNLLGNEAGRSIYDGGTLIASGGKMLVRGPRFSFADWLLTSAVIDVSRTRQAKAESFPETPAVGAEPSGSTVEASYDFPHISDPVGTTAVQTGTSCAGLASAVRKATIANVPGHPAWETGPHHKEEEFARSVPLALFDYLRKSRTQGFVVSLSGGADSSTVAVLVHLMVQLASRELGTERLLEKLSHLRTPAANIASGAAGSAAQRGSGTAADSDISSRALIRRLLACVYQSTRNSSAETLAAAKVVAEATGAEFLEWNVDTMVDGYVATVSSAIGRELDWHHDDMALQNIQARARGPGAWLLANLRDSLLLTTSNRSEAAVGYATMDGDTCGGLAPIAGIDKAFLLEWLKWMERTGPADIGPMGALSAVTSLRPTAELRPPAADQTDEADLMPYRVLDAIERSAIRDKLLPIDVLQTLRPSFPNYAVEQLAQWVERFFRLWCRNQWKRERYAPSFHLDDENLDPKTWCRFPILNSGFDRELEELREYARGLGKEQR